MPTEQRYECTTNSATPLLQKMLTYFLNKITWTGGKVNVPRKEKRQ
jgi:hypothetical protein